MLTDKQIGEILRHLERAQNPIFYYDNDADGLCSFVILRRFLGRGKGVAVRSFPDLNAGYAKKAQELKSDYVFVLDKPVLSKEFLEEIEKLNLQIVWIDHHDVFREEFEGNFKNLAIYNPARNSGKDKSEEPVTYLVYKITKRKEDLWLATAGCVADHYLPDFITDFAKLYVDFWGDVKEPFEAYYETEIGKIARALNFGIKDSTSNVVRLQNFLISCKGPGDVFSENNANYAFRKKYMDIKKKYDSLIEKAKQCAHDKILFFEYGGELSISSDISNELCYLHSNKYIVVAYKKGNVVNVSIRGKNAKQVLAEVLKKIDGTGGGHQAAVGARISASELGKFKEALEEEIKKNG